MGLNIGLKPLHSVDRAKAGNHALTFEKGEVAVDRCQRDVRVFLLKHLVQRLGRWVLIRTAQAGKDGIALAKLLRFAHWHLPFRVYLRLILICGLSIPRHFFFVKSYLQIILK